MRSPQLIILAAGSAQRFGSVKQLAAFNGKPMLESVIQSALDAQCTPWVALGANSQCIRDRCAEILTYCKTVEVELWDRGLSESLRSVLLELLPAAGASVGVLVLLGDQPWLSSRHITRILKKVSENTSMIVAASYGGRAGVPAYFPEAYVRELLNLEGDAGARQMIADKPHVLMDLGEGTRDVDVPADLSD